MTREEHLKFCNICTKRKFNTQKGIICSLTNEIADFNTTCPNFEKDETIKLKTYSQTNTNTNKPKHIILFATYLLLSAIISYFIQNSNFLYSGDSLGNIAIFIFSFFALSILMYKFLIPVKLNFVHFKSIIGIIGITSTLTIFIFAIALISENRFLFLGFYMLLLSIYNFIYFTISKFWINNYKEKTNKILSILNITFYIPIFLIMLNISIKDSYNHFDSEDLLILLIITSITLINIIYSIKVIKDNKKI